MSLLIELFTSQSNEETTIVICQWVFQKLTSTGYSSTTKERFILKRTKTNKSMTFLPKWWTWTNKQKGRQEWEWEEWEKPVWLFCKARLKCGLGKEASHKAGNGSSGEETQGQQTLQEAQVQVHFFISFWQTNYCSKSSLRETRWKKMRPFS